MSDLDGDSLALFLLPVGNKGVVELAIEFTRRIIGHVDQCAVLRMGGDSEAQGQGRGKGGIGE